MYYALDINGNPAPRVIAYETPELAALLNGPEIYGPLTEVSGVVRTPYMGSTSLTQVQCGAVIPLPAVSVLARIRFAAGLARQVLPHPTFAAWSLDILAPENRTRRLADKVRDELLPLGTGRAVQAAQEAIRAMILFAEAGEWRAKKIRWYQPETENDREEIIRDRLRRAESEACDAIRHIQKMYIAKPNDSELAELAKEATKC